MDDFFNNPKRIASFEPDPNGNHWVERIVDWLEDDIEEDPLSPELVHQFMQHPHWSLSVGEQVLDFLRRNAPVDASPEVHADDQTARNKLRSLLPRLSEWYLRLLIENGSEGDEAIDLVVAEQAGVLYQSIYTRQLASCEGPLLQALSWNRRQAAVSLLANLLVTYPPHDWSATALGISPLMRSNLWNPDWIFPRLLDAMAHATAIAPVLDLANFATRNRLTTAHPAKGHSDSLIGLLGEVVSRMGVLEENPKRFGKTVEEVQHVLGESVALCVSLCDAVAWIGNPAAVPKLNQAMELRHRRIQTEASAALARFGDEAGKARLIQLASDPAARLRVLQYAKEIGIEEEIDEQYKTNVAKAESDLALWLSQTPQMSLPPSELELLSQRTMFWPGYHEPQECFLFRYSYRFPDCEFSNVGMAGPIVHSFAADLADLAEDDIFAAFAGWCAEHDDIYEVPRSHFNSAQLAQAQKLSEHFSSEGYEGVAPLLLGFFVGEIAVVVRAERAGTAGFGVSDGFELLWIPSRRSTRPLRAEDVYCIFKGRKLLRTFNV